MCYRPPGKVIGPFLPLSLSRFLFPFRSIFRPPISVSPNANFVPVHHLLGALGLGLHSSAWTECNMTLLVVCGVLTA